MSPEISAPGEKGIGSCACRKVVAPSMALRVIDRAVQIHGGAGVCGDFGLSAAWAGARTLRMADGPDEVRRAMLAKLELGRPAEIN
jgi:acyl-CoA dehydrogenase